MTKETEKTVWRDKADTEESVREKEFEHGSTAAIPRKAFMGELPIGRSPPCRIQLRRAIVSRSHARVTFRNEEYHLEDLGSTNGTYVNGIKVERCILRNNDQIDIGGVKMLFSEQKTLQKL